MGCPTTRRGLTKGRESDTQPTRRKGKKVSKKQTRQLQKTKRGGERLGRETLRQGKHQKRKVGVVGQKKTGQDLGGRGGNEAADQGKPSLQTCKKGGGEESLGWVPLGESEKTFNTSQKKVKQVNAAEENEKVCTNTIMEGKKIPQ